MHLELIIPTGCNNITAQWPTPPFISPLLLGILEGTDNLARFLLVKEPVEEAPLLQGTIDS